MGKYDQQLTTDPDETCSCCQETVRRVGPLIWGSCDNCRQTFAYTGECRHRPR